MGRKSRSGILLEKSIQAALSAIELYNKPNFLYREESFTILMVNAWELLLKAKILEDNDNDQKCLYIIDNGQKRLSGKTYKKPRYKENRAGNKLTLDIISSINKLNLSNDLKSQLETLVEIRDNSIHFYNESKIFDKKLLEVGTATLKSFVEVLAEWFDRPISKYKLFLIPIAFDIPDCFDLNAFSKESESHRKILEYIAKQENNSAKDTNIKHNISLSIGIEFNRQTTGIPVHSTKNSGNSIKIDSEDKFRNKYCWSYTDNLLKEMKKRYSDFKQDTKFFSLKKELEKDVNYSDERFLDCNKKSGIKKRFYSPNIMKEFDRHYTKKVTQ